jgi:hypothetical protein
MQTAPASVVDESGRPRVGTYAGWVPGVSWDATASRVKRTLQQKTWHYVGISGPQVLAAFAIVDVGWAASAFAYVFDRGKRELAADLSFTGLPGRSAQVADRAGEGAVSTWRGGGAELSLSWPAGSPGWVVKANARGMHVEATLAQAGAPPTMCAIAKIDGGTGNCTHKTVGLAATGVVEAGGRRWELSGATGMLDHTRGILARDTRWRWAMASRPGLSFNLVEGFNGPVENVAWIGDTIVPLGAAHFGFDAKDPMRPWHITCDGGLLDLEFLPEGRRAEDKNLYVAVSRYVQPIGTFRGVIRPGGGAPPIDVANLVGVTEDHVARW